MILKTWRALEGLLFEDTSTGASKFSTLDGLRGIAVLTVFLSHSSGFQQRILPWLNFRTMGHLGVYLFFVLSGYMLTYSLLSRPTVPIFRFYVRRFLRIAPLYYSIVTAVFAIQLFRHTSEFCSLRIVGGWEGYIKHLLFLQGDSVFWTIAAEFEFYFVMPFLALLLLRFGNRAAIMMFALAVAYGIWALLIDWKICPTLMPLRIAHIAHNSQYFDVFLCGVLTAYLARKESFCAWAHQNRRMLSRVGAITGILITALSLILVAKHFACFTQWWVGFRHFSIFYGVAFSIVILAACYGEGLLDAILNNKLLRIAGIVCFSWYLIHFVVITEVNALFHYKYDQNVVTPWNLAEAIRFCTSFVFTFIVSIILYLSIEKPFMMLSRNLMKPRAKSVGVPA